MSTKLAWRWVRLVFGGYNRRTGGVVVVLASHNATSCFFRNKREDSRDDFHMCHMPPSNS